MRWIDKRLRSRLLQCVQGPVKAAGLRFGLKTP